MEDRNNIDLAERVQRLESVVEQLSLQVEEIHSTGGFSPVSPITKSVPVPPPPVKEKQTLLQARHEGLSEPFPVHSMPQSSPSSTWTIPEQMKKSEYWLNKIGMALLLFGAVFLFKYSVEQGWLNPTIRVLFGLALGAALSAIGFRLHNKRKHFSQVLLGGSIATFYITGFAAFQLFHLVPYSAAFSFYVATTLYSFSLALKQDEFIFSLIAIAGGLGTPFLLYTGEGSLPGLMLYLCILLTGASAVYFYKGWWSCFWTACVGGWTVISIAMFGDNSLTYAPVLDKVSIEAALFLALPFFWLVPLARQVAFAKMPGLLKVPQTQSAEKKPGAYQPDYALLNVNLLTVITPFISLFLSTAIWQWPDAAWGAVSLGLSLAFAGVGWVLNTKTELKTFAYTHLVVGVIFLAIALSFFLDGDVLLVALILQAAAIHLINVRVDNKSLAPLAHTLYAIVGFWVLGRVGDSQQGIILLNAQALSDLVLPVSAFALFRSFKDINEKRIYLIGGFAALGGILFRELDGNIEFLIISTEAMAFLYVISRIKDKSLLIVSHLFNGVIAAWLIIRMFEGQAGAAVFNLTALADILVIAASVGATFLLSEFKEKPFYFLFAHVALLLWFMRELSSLTNGQGIVSVAWGLYTIALFVFGLRRNLTTVTKTAMVTLLVLVGKLFLVDLAHLETIWRVLLFLGLGAVLLFLSYYFKALWKANTH